MHGSLVTAPVGVTGVCCTRSPARPGLAADAPMPRHADDAIRGCMGRWPVPTECCGRSGCTRAPSTSIGLVHRGDGPAVDRAGGADDRRWGRAAQRRARRRAARRVPAVLPRGPPDRRRRRHRRPRPRSPCCRSSTSTSPPASSSAAAAAVLGVVWWNSAFEKRPSRPSASGPAAPAGSTAQPARPQRGDRPRRRAPRRRHRQGGARPLQVRLTPTCPSDGPIGPDPGQKDASPVASGPWRSTGRPPTSRS